MNEDNGQIELTESTQRVQTSAKTVLNDMKIYWCNHANVRIFHDVHLCTKRHHLKV